MPNDKDEQPKPDSLKGKDEEEIWEAMYDTNRKFFHAINANINENMTTIKVEINKQRKEIEKIIDENKANLQNEIGHIEKKVDGIDRSISSLNKEAQNNRERMQRNHGQTQSRLSKVEQQIEEVKEIGKTVKTVATKQACDEIFKDYLGNQKEINNYQLRHDRTFPRPCGDPLPWSCFGLFEPKRTDLRETIERLNKQQQELMDDHPECFMKKW